MHKKKARHFKVDIQTPKSFCIFLGQNGGKKIPDLKKVFDFVL